MNRRATVSLVLLTACGACERDATLPADAGTVTGDDARSAEGGGCSSDGECPRGMCRGGACMPVAARSLGFGGGWALSAYDPRAAEIRGAVAGDFDGDRLADLVISVMSVTMPVNATLQFAKGHGDGTFALGPQTSTGDDKAPRVLVAGKFDSGDATDVVAGDAVAGLALYLGKGTGTFQSPVLVAANTSQNPVVADDWNGDGRADLVRVAPANQVWNLQSLVAGGNGTLQAKPEVPLAAATPFSLTSGDVNGDGKSDVVTGGFTRDGPNAGNTLVEVMLGDAAGGFRPTTMFHPGGRPRVVAVADFDRDGRQDLLLNDGVRSGHGDGTFSNELRKISPAAAALDFNGDGLLDIAGGAGTGVIVFLGSGDGAFDQGVTFPFKNQMVRANEVGFADLNGDGLPDVYGWGIEQSGLEAVSWNLQTLLNTSH